MSEGTGHVPVIGRRGLIGLGLASAAGILALDRFVLRKDDNATEGVLRVGSQKGGTKSLITAAGALKGTRYRVEWSEFPAAQHLLEALSAEAIDVGAVGDAPFQFAYQAGNPIVVVQAARIARARGASAIIVPEKSPIRSAADLKGRRIVTGRGSAGHYLLLRALASAGLGAGDVTIIFLPPGDAKAALASGAADAWSTWSPYVGVAVLHDHNRIAVDGVDLLDSYLFQAASIAAVRERRALLADFLARHARALTWSNAHPAEAAAVLARETGLPTDVARYTIERQRWSVVPIDGRLLEQEHRLTRLFSKEGGFAARRDVNAGFDESVAPVA